jgi:hypothetical protein
MTQPVSRRTPELMAAVRDSPRWARACVLAGTALTVSSSAALIVLGVWR